MEQRPPVQQDPTLLRDLQAEVSAESAPLLQFIVQNGRYIAGGVALFLVVLACVGLWRWHAAGVAREANEELARALLIQDGEERLKALGTLADRTPEDHRFSVLTALARAAAEQGNHAAAADAYGRAADVAGKTPAGTAATLARAAMLLRAGRAADALPALQALDAGLPETLRQSLLPFLADAARQAGRKDLAAELYRRLADGLPEDEGAYYRFLADGQEGGAAEQAPAEN